MDSKNKCYSVYELIFPNGKRYIGLTRQELNKRWNNGKGYKRQGKISEAIKQFGWENIKKNIVKDGLSAQEGAKLEQELIKKYDTINNGYNIMKGGDLGSDEMDIIIDGVAYTAKQLAQMSPINDITYHDITNRLNSHKWDLEKTITQPLTHKNNKYLYKDSYYTMNELLQFSTVEGLTAGLLNNRIRRHKWDIERALTQPLDVKMQPNGVGDKIYYYNNKWMNSYELWLIRKDKNISQFNIVDRINHHGWSIEDAITKPPKHYGGYEYNGAIYSTEELTKISPIPNIQKNHITDRLRHGWSVEEAITIPIGITRKKYYSELKE